MSSRRKTIVGVIFGGRSVEHDVSVVTGHQVMRAFSSERYEIVPIYINRAGRWYTGDALRDLKNYDSDITRQEGIQETLLSPAVQHHGLVLNPQARGLFARSRVQRLDVVFPALHGSHGEDGTVQGLLELADIAYVGCGVVASALANDKLLTKIVLRGHDIPVVDGLSMTRADWLDDPDSIIERVENTLSYPVFVKPVTLGSSIGIGRADSAERLRAAIDIAINFDRRVLVEQAVMGGIEINCAVMGDDTTLEVSVLEQPVSWEQFLTYEEKYLRGDEGMKSAERVIPAPLSDELTRRIQELARQAFRVIDGRGTARLDFLVKPDEKEVYLNEINTMPGSLAFYLWQEMGLSPEQVVEQLVHLAQSAHAEKRRNTYDYKTSLIGLTAARGLKGTKGSKNRAEMPDNREQN